MTAQEELLSKNHTTKNTSVNDLKELIAMRNDLISRWVISLEKINDKTS